MLESLAILNLILLLAALRKCSAFSRDIAALQNEVHEHSMFVHRLRGELKESVEGLQESIQSKGSVCTGHRGIPVQTEPAVPPRLPGARIRNAVLSGRPLPVKE